MKLLSSLSIGLILLSTAFATAAEQALLNCTVTEIVNSYVFEGSLSVDEYPDVSITETKDGKEVFIGASLYSETGGDQVIVASSTRTGASYSIFPASGSEAIRVSINYMKNTGEVRVADDDLSDFTLVAKMKCR